MSIVESVQSEMTVLLRYKGVEKWVSVQGRWLWKATFKPRLNGDSHGVVEEGARGEKAMLALPEEKALCGSCEYKAAAIVGHMTKTKAT